MNASIFHSLLNYDKETGVFTWKANRPNGVKAGSVATRPWKEGYLRITVLGKPYSAHRLAWAMAYGKFPECQIDHINGNPADNRLDNLREASQHQNQQNKNSAGVTWNKSVGKWQASIKKNGKSFYLGCYDDKDVAIAAYRRKSVELFGEFSRWCGA